MKKKFLLFMIAAILSCYIPTHADTTQDRIDKIKKEIEILQAQLSKLEKQQAEEQRTQETDFTYNNKGIVCIYTGNGTTVFNGKTFTVLYFDFTNNTGDAIRPTNLVIQAFQNGIEVQSYSLFGSDISEIDNTSKDILNGTSIKIAYAYDTDSKEDMTIRIHPNFTWENSDVKEYTISLQ